MKPAQINFVKECLPAAVSAGAAFNLNPLVILAQAAFESGWGTSNLAKECRNYFGLTARSEEQRLNSSHPSSSRMPSSA